MTRARRPGPALLFLGAALLWACANPRPSIPAGYAFTDSTRGVLFLRVEMLDIDGTPRDLEGPVGIRLVSEATGDSEIYDAASAGPAGDVLAELPAGDYRAVFMTQRGFGGFVERWYVIRFHVAPGVVSYAGLVRFYHRMGVLEKFTPYDEYDAALGRLSASHSGLEAKTQKSLLRLYTARASELEEQPWQGPAHALPEPSR